MMTTMNFANTQLTSDAFAALGLNEVAYVRRATVDGQTGYAAFGADGTPLFMAPSRDVALAAVTEDGLEPVSTH